MSGKVGFSSATSPTPRTAFIISHVLDTLPLQLNSASYGMSEFRSRSVFYLVWLSQRQRSQVRLVYIRMQPSPHNTLQMIQKIHRPTEYPHFHSRTHSQWDKHRSKWIVRSINRNELHWIFRKHKLWQIFMIFPKQNRLQRTARTSGRESGTK